MTWVMRCSAGDGFETVTFDISEESEAFSAACLRMAQHTYAAHDGDDSVKFVITRVEDDDAQPHRRPRRRCAGG